MALHRYILKMFSSRYRSHTLHEDVIEFLDQLSLLLNNNVPPDEALELLQEGWSSQQMSGIVRELQKKMAEGSTLVAAMAEHPAVFEPFLLELMATAQQQGKLPEVLKQISNYKQMSADVSFSTSARLRGALVYPIAVVIIALIVTSILMIFVIPQFESLFAGFGADLPPLTELVVDISSGFQAWWWVILLLATTTPTLWIRQKQHSASFHRFALRILMMIPGYGSVYRQSLSAHLLYTWALMLNCGQTLKQAVSNSAGVRVGPYYQQMLREIGNNIGDDSPLHSLLEKQGNLFSSRLARVVRMSERADIPQQLLQNLATSYQGRIELRLKTMSALHEVFIMVILGMIVGTLVIAMYLPIFKMGSAIG